MFRKDFSAIESIVFGFKALANNWRMLLLYYAVYALIISIGSMGTLFLASVFPLGGALGLLLLSIPMITFSVGWCKIGLAIVDNKAFSYRDLFAFYNKFIPRIFLINLISGSIFLIIALVIISLGLCVPIYKTFFSIAGCVLSGIVIFYIILRLRFAQYFVIDRDEKSIQSLRSSWDLTKVMCLDLFRYQFLCMLIPTFLDPAIRFADAKVYRFLLEKQQAR